MKRLASISIVVDDLVSAEEVNALLHEYHAFILGRMGLPLREYGVSFIHIALCAEEDSISALSGRLGRIPKVSVKTSYSQKMIG